MNWSEEDMRIVFVRTELEWILNGAHTHSLHASVIHSLMKITIIGSSRLILCELRGGGDGGGGGSGRWLPMIIITTN